MSRPEPANTPAVAAYVVVAVLVLTALLVGCCGGIVIGGLL